MNKKLLIGLIVGLFFVLAAGFILFSGVLQASLGSTSNTKIAIPHFGAYSCQSVGTGSPSYSIGASGFWIDKQSIGAYTDQVTSINVYVPSNVWVSIVGTVLGGDVRALVKVCDVSHNGCVEYPKSIIYSGNTALSLPFSSFNPNEKSVFVTIQGKATALSGYADYPYFNSNSQISYSFTKYGLKYVSTTGNPAGSLFGGCESSCDLTCPTQKSRSDTGLIYTDKNSLLPTESVPVLEYWEDLNPDLNAQFGGTILSNNMFCFGGVTYTAKTLTLDNGNSYIYPDYATRQNKQCCPGAVTSTSSEDKICQSDYTWKTIVKTDKIKCVSDFNCPGQGQYTCQNKLLNGYHCGSDNYCVKGVDKSVACCSQADCPSDQTCQFNKCVGGNKDKLVCPFGCCINEDAYNTKTCDTGYVCKDHACVVGKGEFDCSDKLSGLIPTTGIQTVEKCGFLGSGCIFGSGTTTSQCGFDYTFVIIIAIVLIILAFVFAMTKNKGKGKNNIKSNSKSFKWLIIILAIGLILYFFWAYLLVIIIILVLLAALDHFLLGDVIKKIIF